MEEQQKAVSPKCPKGGDRDMGYTEDPYLSFAENDRRFFRDAYDHGIRGGALAVLGQNICERYLKHLISE